MVRSREEVLDVLCKQLKALALNEVIELTPELAATTTLDSFSLSSLDTVQLALDLEDAFNIDVRAADLQKDHTILQIAEHLSKLE
jgi:acyl carrier protein